jgi:Glycosyl hydrolase family 79 C-terminal beta domain
VNNYFNGGATNVSNTFASALWGLDFMHWWAAHGAAGLDFHTGDRVAAGNRMTPSRYTAFFTGTNGFVVRPLGYGIQAFALGSRGRLLPLSLSAHADLILSAYGVLAPDRSVYVTLINKEHGPAAESVTVTLEAGARYTRGQVIFLTAPGGDVAALAGVTLGGARILEDGTWAGAWTALDPTSAGVFSVKVPAASAAIVRLSGPSGP